MSNDFFAFLSRMKYIDRWALMRNTEAENLMQHSFEVALLAHALVTISNARFGTELDADKAAVIGLFHDASEILTGDMPTPVKYYSTEIRSAYKKVEEIATEKLVEMLPEDMQPAYRDVMVVQDGQEELWKMVKAADKLSALIKCVEEEKAGNREFTKAKEATEAAVHALDCPAAELFLSEFLPSYRLTLDQLK
ncbi:MAG TPA: 5'-deoxynucleotidase [Clostridiales bacterium]|nr:5'-deoxynucleotidase [Clostridiales bacterium]